MCSLIEIGIHTDGKVMLDMDKSSNPHIAISGRSGAGKSVAGQKIIRNIAVNGASPIIVFDMHRLFSDENIFPEYRNDIKEKSHDIKADSAGISIPLFSPLMYTDGKAEDMLDVITSITNVLSSAIRLGARQREYLFEAVDFVAEEKLYEKYGITALDRALNMVNDEKAAAIQDKLRYIFKKNIFHNGPNFIEDHKINILRLSKFSEPTQALIVEIILAYIWRLANTGVFRENGLCLFLDECQNLNWGKTGIISTILSEGRKLGLQLVLITQALGGSSKADLTRCLLQAGNQLFFSPPENEIAMVGRLIGEKRQAYWQMRLKTLKVGECVVNGSLIINEAAYNGALKIKI